MDSGLYAIEQPVAAGTHRYSDTLDEVVLDVIRGVDHEMRRQPAHMVLEMIDAQLNHLYPSVMVDPEALREAAANISVGMPV